MCCGNETRKPKRAISLDMAAKKTALKRPRKNVREVNPSAPAPPCPNKVVKISKTIKLTIIERPRIKIECTPCDCNRLRHFSASFPVKGEIRSTGSCDERGNPIPNGTSFETTINFFVKREACRPFVLPIKYNLVGCITSEPFQIPTTLGILKTELRGTIGFEPLPKDKKINCCVSYDICSLSGKGANRLPTGAPAKFELCAVGFGFIPYSTLDPRDPCQVITFGQHWEAQISGSFVVPC